MCGGDGGGGGCIFSQFFSLFVILYPINWNPVFLCVHERFLVELIENSVYVFSWLCVRFSV